MLGSATRSVEEASDLIAAKARFVQGPDVLDVANHLAANLTIGAHAVRRACEEQIDRTGAVRRRSGVPETSWQRGLPLPAARAARAHLVRVEAAGVFALQRQNRPPERLPIQQDLRAWVSSCQQTMQQPHPSLTSLRAVASSMGVVHSHTQAIAAAAAAGGVITSQQRDEAVSALRQPAMAWQEVMRETTPMLQTGAGERVHLAATRPD